MSFETGETLLCSGTFQCAKHITMYVVQGDNSSRYSGIRNIQNYRNIMKTYLCVDGEDVCTVVDVTYKMTARVLYHT